MRTKILKSLLTLCMGLAIAFTGFSAPAVAASSVLAEYPFNSAKAAQIMTCTGDGVRIRDYCSLDSNTIAFLKKGDKVRTIAYANGFYRIDQPIYGWVYSSYLE